MKAFLVQPSLDATGMWASAICAVHCIAVPVLLSFTAFGSLAFFENESIEYTILSFSIALGFTSLLLSYFRHHKKKNALYVLTTGFILIGIGRFTTFAFLEIILTSVGALTIAAAHFLNMKLCRILHVNTNEEK